MDYKSLSDEQLVKLARKDSDAFECLYLRYESTVLFFSKIYLKSLFGGDINDLCSYGWMGFRKAVEKYNGDSPFNAYAKLCIKTSMLSAIKTSNSNKQKPLNEAQSLTPKSYDDDGDKDISLVSADGNPETEYISRESFIEMQEKFNSLLSKFEKQIFELQNDGYSNDEISEKTGKSVKSIENAKQRIKKKLQSAGTPQ